MRIHFSSFVSVLKDTLTEWQNDNASLWSAALAYYTVFSIGPLLLVIISILGLFLSNSQIEKNIYTQMQSLIGAQGANFLQTLISTLNKPRKGMLATIIGGILLVFGAVGIFGQLEQMLNFIWGVTKKPGLHIKELLINRLLNFSMIAVVIFLLLVSLVASALISLLGTFFQHILPFDAVILQWITFLISLFIITFLFAFLFKVLPDVKLPWKYVLISAFITSFLFTIGKTIIGVYIGTSAVTSTYGAAGSVIVLLLWVYYTTQIVFFGAEFTKVFFLHSGKKISPSHYAVLTEKAYILNQKYNKTQKHTISKTITKRLVYSFTFGFINEFLQKMFDLQKTNLKDKHEKHIIQG